MCQSGRRWFAIKQPSTKYHKISFSPLNLKILTRLWRFPKQIPTTCWPTKPEAQVKRNDEQNFIFHNITIDKYRRIFHVTTRKKEKRRKKERKKKGKRKRRENRKRREKGKRKGGVLKLRRNKMGDDSRNFITFLSHQLSRPFLLQSDCASSPRRLWLHLSILWFSNYGQNFDFLLGF